MEKVSPPLFYHSRNTEIELKISEAVVDQSNMKTHLILLTVSLVLSACQGTTPTTGQETNPSTTGGTTSGTTTGTTTGTTNGGNTTPQIADDSVILYSWQQTLPAEFKNLAEGQTAYQVGMNSAGDAVIAWLYEDSSFTRHIYYSHRKNSVWSHPTFGSPLKVVGTNEQMIQKIVVNEAGEVKLFFSEAGKLYLKEFKNDAWQTPQLIATYSYQSHMTTRFAFSPNQQKIMIITASHGSMGVVYFNGSTWSNTGILKFGDNTQIGIMGVESVDIAVNDSGKALMSFNHYFPIYIHYRTYRATFNGSVWSLPATKEDAITPNEKGSYTEVEINNAGKMVSLWQSDDGRIHVQENNGNGWEEEAFTHGAPSTPVRMFMNSAGQYVVVASESSQISIFRRNGIFLWTEASVPTTKLTKFELIPTSATEFVVAWGSDTAIGYGRCSYTGCDSGKVISDSTQLGESGTPITRTLTHVAATSNRVIIFWDARSSANSGSNNEIGGSEDYASAASFYNMPLIFYKYYGAVE